MRTARTIFLGLTLAVSICITGGLGYAANVLEHETPQYETPPAFVPDQVVVGFKPGTPGEAKRAAHAQAGGRLINTHAAINADLVGIPSGTVLNKIAVYKHNPNVRYAEPNYYRTLSLPPSPPSEGFDDFVCSDWYWDEQWGLHNAGQSLLDPATGGCTFTGGVDADIDWLEAWDSGVRGRSAIKIAIVDTGIESTHPDLVSKIVETWVASRITTEGPEDLIGHGTHVAGIAAAATNNGIGISGVGINARVGSLKACKCYPGPGWLCQTGICEDWDTAEAISYATDEGYHVINMSFGGPYVSPLVEDAVNQALGAGLVLVSSAGNEYSYNEPSYPAAFDGVIAVAATDRYDNLASFSNFGDWVEVAAPGVDILSAYPGAGCGGIADCYNWLSGTSMASPIVAGAAALVFDNIGGPDPVATSPILRDAVINAILNNADHTGALGQNMLAWTRYGRLNLQAALTGGGGNIPPNVQITSPTAGFSFNEGDNIIIDAIANDSDGNVTQVEFFQEAVSLGKATDLPYSVTWNDVQAGSYSLTAVATDDSGATTTSSAVSITVSSTSGGCTAEAWDPTKTYFKRDIVSHDNNDWKAKNTSQNVEPGTNNRYWTDLGLCN
ncbi:MAG: S8 family serine peptidase [Desulfobacteraceae bacterium]|nr:S8 family serine peptidase [Desulfobacteraceae bacterium]